MQDDLSALMARNLHLSAVQPPQNDAFSAPPTPQVVPQPAPITYITQHYHHSAHIAPVYSQDTQTSTILSNAGINAAALLPSQLQLFKNAQPDQQQRLVELWRISPPTYGNQLPTGVNGNWPGTSMEQEEQAARERWEEQDRLKNLCMLPEHEMKSHAEPYMSDGYQSLPNINGVTAPTEYKQSIDPVYQNSREWWSVEDKQPIEYQYGMIQHMLQFQNAHTPTHDGDEEML